MKTVDIYTTLLEGNELSAKEFDAILASQVNEDEFLEFKHGDVLKSKKDASVLLRKYVSGFANSEGGICRAVTPKVIFRLTWKYCVRTTSFSRFHNKLIEG